MNSLTSRQHKKVIQPLDTTLGASTIEVPRHETPTAFTPIIHTVEAPAPQLAPVASYLDGDKLRADQKADQAAIASAKRRVQVTIRLSGVALIACGAGSLVLALGAAFFTFPIGLANGLAGSLAGLVLIVAGVGVIAQRTWAYTLLKILWMLTMISALLLFVVSAWTGMSIMPALLSTVQIVTLSVTLALLSDDHVKACFS